MRAVGAERDVRDADGRGDVAVDAAGGVAGNDLHSAGQLDALARVKPLQRRAAGGRVDDHRARSGVDDDALPQVAGGGGKQEAAVRRPARAATDRLRRQCLQQRRGSGYGG